jgi:hypothetical protein
VQVLVLVLVVVLWDVWSSLLRDQVFWWCLGYSINYELPLHLWSRSVRGMSKSAFPFLLFSLTEESSDQLQTPREPIRSARNRGIDSPNTVPSMEYRYEQQQQERKRAPCPAQVTRPSPPPPPAPGWFKYSTTEYVRSSLKPTRVFPRSRPGSAGHDWPRPSRGR